VFTPTHVGGGSGFKPLGARAAPKPTGPTDADGWGEDAPPVTRTQLEKVASAYQPTKVNMSQLQSGHDATRSSAPSSGSGDVVRGGYQPIGKIDIAEIRRQAKESGQPQDDRPTVVKGAYEPVGRVDIAAIRAKAQGPGGVSSPPSHISPAATGGSGRDDGDEPKSMGARSAAFSQPAQSERLTSMPKPKVANKFGGASSFTGTKAPAPGNFGAQPASTPQVGSAGRSFADSAGKTPAQLWAEKKAREGGGVPAPASSTPAVAAQTSGEGGWKSGYTGKSWAPVQTTHTGKSMEQAAPADDEPADEPVSSPSGGVSSMRDRFAGAPPMGQTSLPSRPAETSPPPPPMDMSSKPNAVAMPGLPSRPEPAEEPPSPEPSSPVRIAMPVGKSNEAEDDMARAAQRAAPPPPAPEPEPEPAPKEPSRGAMAAAVGGAAAVGVGVGVAAGAAAASSGADESTGHTAIAQYDYEKAEDNELELQEGERITHIDMVDEDWWMGRNSRGEEGLFPANYVELEEGGADAGSAAAPPPPPVVAEPEPEPEPEPADQGGHTATAEYDYEAAEDNELSFPENAKITGVVSTCLLHSNRHVTKSLTRNFPTRIGGSVITMGPVVCSLPTTLLLISKMGMRTVGLSIWNV
jgi:drebrin-like protein